MNSPFTLDVRALTHYGFFAVILCELSVINYRFILLNLCWTYIIRRLWSLANSEFTMDSFCSTSVRANTLNSEDLRMILTCYRRNTAPSMETIHLTPVVSGRFNICTAIRLTSGLFTCAHLRNASCYLYVTPNIANFRPPSPFSKCCHLFP